MKYSLFTTVITGILILVFSYQPPLVSHAQLVKVSTVDSVTTVYHIDTSLLDSIRYYYLASKKLKQHCKKGVAIIKEQQGVMVQQQKMLDTLITKNSW